MHTYIHTHTDRQTDIHTYITYIHTYMHTYIHMYICIFIYIMKWWFSERARTLKFSSKWFPLLQFPNYKLYRSYDIHPTQKSFRKRCIMFLSVVQRVSDQVYNCTRPLEPAGPILSGDTFSLVRIRVKFEAIFIALLFP